MANIMLKDIQFPGLNNTYKIPEVDNTLTISGAAADAKKTGDVLSDLKQELTYTATDILSQANKANTTNAGVTFTWNADKTACTANGTATGSSPSAVYMYGGNNTIPSGFVAGGTYHVQCNTTNNYLRLGFYFYKNGSYSSAKTCGGNDVVTIPSDATGMWVLVYAEKNKTFNNDVLSNIGIFNYLPSALLDEKIENLRASVSQAICDASGRYLFEFVQGNASNSTAAVYSQPEYIITKNPVYFNNEFIKITFANGYTGKLYWKNNSGSNVSRDLRTGVNYFYGGSSVPVRIGVYKGGSNIYPSESVAVSIERIDCSETEDIGYGVVEHELNIVNNQAIGATYPYFYYSSDTGTSVPIKIPKSGLRIGFKPICHSKDYMDGLSFTYPAFSYIAVKKGNNGLSLQTDNDDVLAVSSSTSKQRQSVYVPYIEDCYLIVRVQSPYIDSIYVTSGNVNARFCGVYNIFPTALQVIDNMEGFSDQNSLDIFGAQSDWYSYSSMLYYATAVRIRDVNRIICSPKYTLLAEIYKINDDGTITRYSDVWGAWSGTRQTESEINASGLSVIDLSEYDFDGYALVAIQSPIVFVRSSTSIGFSSKRLTTGNLGGYKDVLDNVFIEYRNSVRVSEIAGMPSILAENIEKICSWQVPVYPDGFYVEQHSTTPHYFPAQYNSVPSMYNGTFVANSLLMNVTAKSALTCLNNRNGRMRKMQRIESAQGTPTDGNIGYGLTCTNFTSVIRGLKENYTSWSYAYQDKRKFDTFDFDYKTDLLSLKPGDVLTKHILTPEAGRPTDSHCMTVSSIIVVNGVVKAVNVIEATIPYCRFASFIDEEYYIEDTNWIVKQYTIDKLADYMWINRIKPEYLKPIESVFEMHPENTGAGTVMCDRGTESIYGIHAQYVELSFADADVTTNIYLYKDGTLLATVPKSGASTVNSLKLINVASYINGEGLYTVKTDKSNDVQETFYVKDDVQPITYTEDEETTSLTIPNISDFIWMEVWNGTTDTAEHAAQRTCRTYTLEDVDVDETTNTGSIDIPRYINEQDISSINRVYETQYGTYWAGINGRVSTDYYGVD